MKSNIVNVVAFNIAWFGLVFIGNLFIPIAVLIFVFQCWCLRSTKNDLVFILSVATLGIWLDFALVFSGVFIFPGTNGIPLWLIMLWLFFATTIRQSIAFLEKSKVLQFLVGATFAPLSYLGGAKLSAVTLVPPLGVSYMLLACIWAPLMLIIFRLSRWMLTLEENNDVD